MLVRLTLILIALLVSFAPPAYPQDQEPLPSPIIFASPEEGWPPYHMGSAPKDPARHGIMVDVFATACARLGLEVSVRHFPEKRCMMLLRQGAVHVYTKARSWVEHPWDYQWSAEVVASEDTLIHHRNVPLSYVTPKDLQGKRIGTVLGYIYPTLEQLFERGVIHRDDAPDVHAQIRKLEKGRTDAAIVNKLVARWVLANSKEISSSDYAFTRNVVESAGYRFVFSPKHNWAPLIHPLNEALDAMRSDGTMDAILAEYR